MGGRSPTRLLASTVTVTGKVSSGLGLASWDKIPRAARTNAARIRNAGTRRRLRRGSRQEVSQARRAHRRSLPLRPPPESLHGRAADQPAPLDRSPTWRLSQWPPTPARPQIHTRPSAPTPLPATV